MKRFSIKAILIIQFMLFITISFGQTKIGITAGLNLTNSTIRAAADKTEFILRYNTGVYSEFSINDKIKFEPILLYSVKGWHFNSYIPSESGGQMNMHYINLQLIGKYFISKKISILGGLELGYLIETKRNPYNQIFEDYYEKKDIGLIFGAAYQLSDLLSINLKYLHGLAYLRKSDIYDFNGNVTGVGKYGKNRVIQLGVAFSIIRK